MSRDTPYRSFNFRIAFGGAAASAAFGGFAEVSGLGPPPIISAYRAGGSRTNPVRKILPVPQAATITLKRGLVDSRQFRAWINSAASAGAPRPDIAIILADENAAPSTCWILHQAMPIKHSGPALSAKGTEVAMEELVLGCESITVE